MDDFRREASENLARPGDYVLVNYQRNVLHQGRAMGHISPVAAYDRATDRFLVLDVAAYRYPPVWVSASELFAAMNTTDSESGRSRGWVLVQAHSPD